MFLILFLHSVSMVVGDRRWQQHKTSFSEFLKAEVRHRQLHDARPRCPYQYRLAASHAVSGTFIGLVCLFVRVGW